MRTTLGNKVKSNGVYKSLELLDAETKLEKMISAVKNPNSSKRVIEMKEEVDRMKDDPVHYARSEEETIVKLLHDMQKRMDVINEKIATTMAKLSEGKEGKYYGRNLCSDLEWELERLSGYAAELKVAQQSAEFITDGLSGEHTLEGEEGKSAIERVINRKRIINEEFLRDMSSDIRTNADLSRTLVQNSITRAMLDEMRECSLFFYVNYLSDSGYYVADYVIE